VTPVLLNYNPATTRYFGDTPSAGRLEGPGVARGSAGSPAHGALVQFELRIEGGVVREARFTAFGCPHTIAVAAWTAEHAAGLPRGAGLPRSVAELSALFAVPIEKRGRLLVVEDAWAASMAAAPAP
jgi:hypothetical protein